METKSEMMIVYSTSSSSLPFKHTTTSTWLSIQSWGLVRIWSRILFRFCSFLKVIEFKHPKVRLCLWLCFCRFWQNVLFYRLDHWWTFSKTSLTNFFWRLGWQRCQLNVSWCFWSCQSLLNIIFTLGNLYLRESSLFKGGGGIFNPKIYIAEFGPFEQEIWK